MNNDSAQNFQQQIRHYENLIQTYSGNDPLDLWFKYICWLEKNSSNDVENMFKKSVEHCLSLFEKYENYKQDLRMVKLWIKYIDFQPNPLNLYQILYQQGIGTSHASFYIAWSHYYNTANAFKQAESIYNLGIQLRAQPIEELEAAQKNFRYSVSQRVLYNDSSSKKRTMSSLAEQRQQITSLSAHQNGAAQNKRTRYEYEYPEQAHPQANYSNNNNGFSSTSSAAAETAESQYNQMSHHYQKPPEAQIPNHNNHYKPEIAVNQYQANQFPYQKMEPQTSHHQMDPQHYMPANQLTSNQYPKMEPHLQQTNNYQKQETYVNQCTKKPEMSVPAQNYQKVEPQMQMSQNYYQPKQELQIPPPSYNCPSDPHSSQYQKTPTNSVQQNYSNHENGNVAAGYSIPYVPYESNENGFSSNQLCEPQVVKVFTYDDGFQVPPNFVQFVRNNSDQWNGPLCLEEPYDPNRKCFYPKHIVYPGDGFEYSLEEILARKWKVKAEETKKMEEEAKRKEAEELERQKQQRYMAEMMRKQKEAEERAKYEIYQRQQQAANFQNYSGYHSYQQNEGMKNYGYYENNQQHNAPPQYYQHPVAVPVSNQVPPPQGPMYHQNNYHLNSQPPPQYNQQQHNNYQAQMAPQQSVIVNTKQYNEQQNTSTAYAQQPVPVSVQYNHMQHVAAESQPQNQFPNGQQQNLDPYYNTGLEANNIQKVENFEEPDPEEEFESESEFEEEEQAEEETAESSGTDQFQTPTKVQQQQKNNSEDLEEQIEASTISFSATTTNGISTQKKITIKFRKEKAEKSLESSDSSPATAYSSTGKNKKKKATQYTMLTSYDNENTTFMPSNNNSCSERPTNAVDDAELLLSFSSNHKTTSNDSTVTGDFNRSFGNISFNNNEKTLVPHHFTSTPIRQSASVSKNSTPVSSYKFLNKHASNISLQNDDSLCSFTADQNSFFQAENDEELQKRRMDKALKTISDHMARRDIDPFNSELCKAFLVKLNFPNRENTIDYKIINTNIPKMMRGQTVPLGSGTYSIEKEVGRGSYGAVFRGTNNEDSSVVAIKFQRPANSWELYICTEVKKRLGVSDILPGFMSIKAAVVAPNASVLISEFSQYGSLLDINNRIRTATTKVMHESLVMHFSREILNICDYLHSCNIIHADIKPDNFLLMTIPSVDSNSPSLRLIDFGCAIDMNLFEKGTEFKKIVQTDGFTCIEMLEGRPWSFQTDMFCLAGTIHVMLFGEYMQVIKKMKDHWEIKQKFPRYLKKHVWTEIFTKLLNIKDKNHLPNLKELRKIIDKEMMGMENELNRHIRTLSNLMKKR